MRTSEGDTIHEIIRRRRGRDRAISSYQICIELGWPPSRERAVRQIITAESISWPGILVCSVDDAGYFCAASSEEAHACAKWLRESRDQAQMKLNAFAAQCRKLGLNLDGEAASTTAPPHIANFAHGVTQGIAEVMAAKINPPNIPPIHRQDGAPHP
jgi:predicted Fe-S protein YdhL (DUF1289 family)